MSNEIKPFETWVIRNKYTGAYFTACSGKQAWKKKNHAANAWANTVCKYFSENKEREMQMYCDKWGVLPVKDTKRGKMRPPYFKEQEVWEAVNITEESLSDRLSKAESLLRSLKEDIFCEVREGRWEICEIDGVALEDVYPKFAEDLKEYFYETN